MDKSTILSQADQCVKCGLCLPHCPTYQLYRDEAESPRGRIALLQGVAVGFLEADDKLIGHLDNCLLCRRCEGACPSHVQYASMLDEARTELTAHRNSKLNDLLTNNRLLDMAMGVGRGVGKLLPTESGKGLLGQLAPLIPDRKPFSLKTASYPAQGERKGTVSLFAGCVGRHTDAAALETAIELLTRQGYEVHVPSTQVCCGAIHSHAGESGKAEAFIGKNREAFSGESDAILVVSSGCGQQLQQALGLEAPVMEATAFLAEHCELPDIGQDDIVKTGYYLPCSLGAMSQDDAVRRLLDHAGNGRMAEVEGMGCCGGAGMHMLTHPEMASELAVPILDRIGALELETLLTTNSGCAMHLRQEINRSNLSVQVMHPLEWLVTRLENSS